MAPRQLFKISFILGELIKTRKPGENQPSMSLPGRDRSPASLLCGAHQNICTSLSSRK